MLPKELEIRNEALFEKLIPDSGMSETLEGETLRAINRIIYRYYNDGDYWWRGYGIETAGNAHAFLLGYSPIDVSKELRESDGSTDEEYIEPLTHALEKIVTHIESQTEYLPNHKDMFDVEPFYEEEEDEEE